MRGARVRRVKPLREGGPRREPLSRRGGTRIEVKERDICVAAVEMLEEGERGISREMEAWVQRGQNAGLGSGGERGGAILQSVLFI